MADEVEERAVEQQLEFQLDEQKASLDAVADALSSDPSNAELLSVHSELVQAIKDAEEGLFHLKRARLLREADYALQGSLYDDDVNVEPIPTGVEAEPLADHSYSIGSKCRFRHTNGRWYDGLVVGLGGPEHAKIAFLTPTSESMLMCKFFLQQRCRFGSNCRLSHGVDVPVSSLKKFIPTIWEQLVAGSSIWALSDSKSGIWRAAELQLWDATLKMGDVVFRDDGTSAKLGAEAITLSEYSHTSDDEESDTSSEQSDSSDYEQDAAQGLGFLEGSSTSKGGVQTETVIFAEWENHTRGIASKMMANMGYREESKDVFSLINTQLAMHGKTIDGETSKNQQKQADGEAKKEGRRALVAFDDEIKNLRLQVEKLEEMLNRNRKEKVVYEASMRKLNETRKALADSEAAHASASNAVARKERERRNGSSFEFVLMLLVKVIIILFFLHMLVYHFSSMELGSDRA